MSDLKAGSFGYFSFTHWPGGKEMFMQFYGSVLMILPGHVLIQDDNDHPYLVPKKDLKYEPAGKG